MHSWRLCIIPHSVSPTRAPAHVQRDAVCRIQRAPGTTDAKQTPGCLGEHLIKGRIGTQPAVREFENRWWIDIFTVGCHTMYGVAIADCTAMLSKHNALLDHDREMYSIAREHRAPHVPQQIRAAARIVEPQPTRGGRSSTRTTTVRDMKEYIVLHELKRLHARKEARVCEVCGHPPRPESGGLRTRDRRRAHGANRRWRGVFEFGVCSVAPGSKQHQ